MADFASEIFKRRDALEWTQDVLAQKAGVSRATVANAERGQVISRKAARLIADALNWPADAAVTLARKGCVTIILKGEAAERLRDASRAAGKSADDYLIALLPKSTKGKR